jgi:hypothetical protein
MSACDYIVYHTSRTWGDELDGGGERHRAFYSGGDIPSCLFCAFRGANLGELEGHLRRWVEEGAAERFSIDGKFLRTADGWLEDLEIRPGSGGEPVPPEAIDYSRDFFRFFGPRK